MKYRIEKDTMGEVQVPADALWGAQTQRALENFQISGIKFAFPFGRSFIEALGIIKFSAASANQKLKLLIETQHDINHPGPYFDIVNKQLDYVNTLRERIKLINEKANDNE